MVSINKNLSGTEGWIRQEGYHQVFEKEGKKYTIFTEYLQHGIGWQFVKTMQAIGLSLLTAGTLGIGLAFDGVRASLRNKWAEAFTGLEKQYVVERFPPPSISQTIEKINIVTLNQLAPLSAIQQTKLEAFLFIERVKDHLATMSHSEIESGLTLALSVKNFLTNEDNTILMGVGEALARRYSQSGNPRKAEEIRIKVARELLESIPHDRIKLLGFLDYCRYSSAFDIDQLEKHLTIVRKLNKELTAEEQQLILKEAEKIAKRDVQLGRFDDAYQIRVRTAEAIFENPPLNAIKVKSYLEKLNSPLYSKELIPKEELKANLEEHIALLRNDTQPELKELLLETAFYIAKRYDQLKDFENANAIRQLGYSLFENVPWDIIEAFDFSARVRWDYNKLSQSDLEIGWAKLLSVGSKMRSSSGKEYLLQATEKLSSKYLTPLDVDKVLSMRIDAAKAVFGQPIYLNREALDFVHAGMQEVLKITIPFDAKNNAELLMHAEFLAGELAKSNDVKRAVAVLRRTVEILYPFPHPIEVQKKALLNTVESISLGLPAYKALALRLKASRVDIPDDVSLDDVSLDFIRSHVSEAIVSASAVTEPEAKTAFLSTIEAVAQEFVKVKDFDTALSIRMQTAQKIKASPPLADLKTLLANQHSKLGSKVYPVDTTLFKNHSLSIQRRTFVDGSKKIHIEAKLGYPARAQVQKTLDWVFKNPGDLEKGLPPGFCSGVAISTEDTVYLGRESKNHKAWEGDFSTSQSQGFLVKYQQSYYMGATARNCVIDFKGIGKVRIGNKTPEFLSLYNRLSIELEPGISEDEAVEKITIMLAALGLEAVVSTPRKEDEERIKVLQLFRLYYPKQAYQIERDEKWMNEPIENLKREIISRVPKMEQKFKHYLEEHQEDMYRQEVYPGQFIWGAKGLAQEVKAAGGLGLMAGVSADDFDQAVTRFASILKLGALSSQDRFQYGIIAAGASSGQDLNTGGGEYVFTRLITENMPKDPLAYPLLGQFQILYDLALVERCGFAYTGDKYGTKEESSYSNRPSVLELAKTIKNGDGYSFKSNEVLLRNRIPPQFIKGVMVNSASQKSHMIQLLRDNGLVSLNSNGIESINEIPLDQFIHVGQLKAEYWA